MKNSKELNETIHSSNMEALEAMDVMEPIELISDVGTHAGHNLSILRLRKINNGCNSGRYN